MPIILRRLDDKVIESGTKYPTNMNGCYEIAHPDILGAIDPNGTLSEIRTRISEGFMISYPGWNGVIYNDLPTEDGGTTLDDSASFDGNEVRYKWGTGANLLGLFAQSVTSPPTGTYWSYIRPGLVVTQPIDISGIIPAGTLSFKIWWRAVYKTYTQDKTPIKDLREDANEPAYQRYETADSFKVYISRDDGSTYSEVENLVDFSWGGGLPPTEIRLAFVNEGDRDAFLLAYAIMC